MSGSTVWNSPVSQNPTPGMSPVQALTIDDRRDGDGAGPSARSQRLLTIRGCCPR